MSGTTFTNGFCVLDLRNPTQPRPVARIPAPPNTWCLHLRAQDHMLLVIHNKNKFAQAKMADEKAQKKHKVTQHAAKVQDWSAGMAVYDMKNLAAPRQIGFMPVQGSGLHGIWYNDGQWADASARLDGFTDYILTTIVSGKGTPWVIGFGQVG